MEKIRKITIEILPTDEKTESGKAIFDIKTQIETFDASKPKKDEVIWLLEETLAMVKTFKIIKS